jgi:hypothetical protein
MSDRTENRSPGSGETRMNDQGFGRAYVTEARRRLAGCHEKIKHCLAQLDVAQVWWRPRESLNSIANLVLHLCGNLRQWLVAGVGRAADVRDRPREFSERGPLPKEELLQRLEDVVREADVALAAADEARLLEPRRIQGFETTALAAVFDCLAHLSGHTQEIVHMTRLQLGDAYRFAWAPATVEQGAAPEDVSGIETVATRDGTFKDMPGHPLPAAEIVGGAVLPTPPAAEDVPPDKGGAAGQASPLDDYLLKLEQQFQDQEEKGKL